MNKKYQIIYTGSAIRDMEEKVDYISLSFHDPGLAENSTCGLGRNSWKI